MFSFNNTRLLDTALTHRSALNEYHLDESNERLEFLGDAVLELATTDYLYKRFPHADEGEMTSYRASLVKTTTLAKVSQELGLDTRLLMSKGEERGGGRENINLLADTFEAVIGALYLDQGYAACVSVLQEHLFPRFEDILENQAYKDYKTSFQEAMQARGHTTPVYVTVSEAGPDHNKTFTVQVECDHVPWGRGVGKSKQEASQEAAKVALEKLRKE